ncbi:alpha/beta fold hydrolase [Aurantimonas aggregata]|uniref:Alpha/beta fold hydrolase n=1 Tax=Aurantimonas aggregata TaxID=2047720 RepID=A0A6L9MDF6_9HYPH|nr:alpha/beta hydrolase [Aurantimonas aggregata]NDV85874.1 alpha/beta fold hydrolase [Aurantimonas aggregata]
MRLSRFFPIRRLRSTLAPVAASLLGLWLAGCAAALNAATSEAGYERIADLRYQDGERGTYDLYVPDGAGSDTPLVVFIHGGSWADGSKDIYPFLGQALASEGIIVAIPNYRLYPAVRFPGFIEDAATATATIARDLEGGDHGVPAGQRKVFLMGHSAGAQIAGLLATDERWLARESFPASGLAGFIGLAGPYDFLPLTEVRYRQVFPAETRAESQPVAFVDGGEPPMLLIAGEADTVVDPKNTRSLAAKARAQGVSVEEIMVPGVTHTGAITAFATAIPFQEDVIPAGTIGFIRRHAR